MTDDVDADTPTQRSHVRWALIIAAAVVILGIVVVNQVSAARAHDQRVDEYWCTLSGVGPYDRAPNTGKLCIELE